MWINLQLRIVRDGQDKRYIAHSRIHQAGIISVASDTSKRGISMINGEYITNIDGHPCTQAGLEADRTVARPGPLIRAGESGCSHLYSFLSGVFSNLPLQRHEETGPAPQPSATPSIQRPGSPPTTHDTGPQPARLRLTRRTPQCSSDPPSSATTSRQHTETY